MTTPDEHRLPDDVVGAAAHVLGGDPLGDALARWAAEAAVDDAARQRARARWLRVQSEEEATVAGTLLDVAERGRPVALHLAGWVVRGRIAGLGEDFVALRADTGQHVLVPLGAIEVIRTEPGGRGADGDRSAMLTATLGGIVVPLAGDRPEVAARTRNGHVVRGVLRSASPTLLTIRPDGDARAPTWVPVAALVALIVDP